MTFISGAELKRVAKAAGMNSSGTSVNVLKESGLGKDVAFKVWEHALANAKNNGRKTVQDKDVKVLVDFYNAVNSGNAGNPAE